MVTKTQHYLDLLDNPKNWKSWSVVVDEFIARANMIVNSNKELIEAPDVYGLAQEKLRSYQLLQQILWDIALSESDNLEQVHIDKYPNKSFIRYVEED